MLFIILFLVTTTTLKVTSAGDYGDVSFDISCLSAVQSDFNTALSMMYVCAFIFLAMFVYGI